jgi:hypothetical protein
VLFCLSPDLRVCADFRVDVIADVVPWMHEPAEQGCSYSIRVIAQLHLPVDQKVGGIASDIHGLIRFMSCVYTIQ